ncbi:MAG: hypothetical protein ACOYN0_18065, partial [Phycisphaerales bacterium]
PPNAPAPAPAVAPVSLTNLNTVDLTGVLLSHLWQEYHWKADTAAYRGKTLDDRRVVEDKDGSNLREKTSLNASFCEHAITTLDVAVPEGQTLYMRWWIEDIEGRVVQEHPDFSKANADGKKAAAKISTGKYGWRWDGRRLNDAHRRVFVQNEYCWSMVEIRNSEGKLVPVGPLAVSGISVKGEPYRVFVVGEPKDDAALEAEKDGPGNGRWLNSAGDRLQGDCWIKVFRGVADSPAHLAFLGHGAIEATSYNSTKNGAIATPHDRDHKAWIRRGTHGGVEFWLCELIDIEAPAAQSHLISLEQPGGLPVPNNPFCDTFPNQPFKDGVHGHNSFPELGNAFVIDGASVGCTTVRTLQGGSRQSPVARLGDIQCNNAKFGKWNGSAPANESNTPWGPLLDGGSPGSFWNKQNKRARVLDALLPDTFEDPLLCPPLVDAATNIFDPPTEAADRDEPLHMQNTAQNAFLGGFLEHEIPRSPMVPPDPDGPEPSVNPKVRYRVRLKQGAVGSKYYQYHRSAVFGHTAKPSVTAATFECWIPRTLQRLWNGNWRNVLVRDAMQYAWYVEERRGAELFNRLYIGAKPTGAAVWVQLPDGSIGRFRKENLALPALALESFGSRFFAVFKYRIKLAPQPKANVHVWEALAGAQDLFSDPYALATLLDEQLVTEAGVTYLQGQSEVEFIYPNTGDFPDPRRSPGSPGFPGDDGTAIG